MRLRKNFHAVPSTEKTMTNPEITKNISTPTQPNQVKSAAGVLRKAARDYPKLAQRCAEFDEALVADATKIVRNPTM